MSKLNLKIGDRIVWSAYRGTYRGIVLDFDRNYETENRYSLFVFWENPMHEPTSVWRTIPVGMVSLSIEQLSIEEKLTHELKVVREAARAEKAVS